MSAEFTKLAKTFSESAPGRRLKEFSVRHNPDMMKARSELYDFAAQLFEFDGFRDHFTLTRKRTAPETDLDVLDDKSLRGKIIVEKAQKRRDKPIHFLHYVSPNRSGRLGEPMIYSLNATRIIADFADYRLPITYDSPQNTLWKAMLEKGLNNPQSIPHQLDIINKSAYRNPDPISYLRNMFHVLNTHDYHVGLEVWQRGHGEKRGTKSVKSRTMLREFVSNPGN